jgi:hypothetical protein
MQIIRTEPQTGGPQRTPREEIVPVFTASDEVEPDMLFDCSGSMQWETAPPQGSAPNRWTVMCDAMRQVVGAAEALDSQAAQEQSEGSDEKGGLYAAGFNHGLVIVGAGNGNPDEDDDGDLNTANFERKMKAVAGRYGVPDGGTKIMPAVRYLDGHYLAEFSETEDGAPVPVSARPKRARVVFTDGELKDAPEFGARIAEDHADRWPAEHWFIAVLGHGEEHDATLRQYQETARKHPNVHVYSFDQVTNPGEVAEDMAIAVLPQS